MLTDKKIQDFVIVKNFISNFVNDNAKKVIDSFIPFINKKIVTNKGFVSKYEKPILVAEVSEELENIGITGLRFSISLNIQTHSIDVYFNFDMWGLNSIFSEYDNRFGSTRIKPFIFTVLTNDTILNEILPYQIQELLDTDQVVKNYNITVSKKKEYEAALKNTNSYLKSFVTRS